MRIDIYIYSNGWTSTMNMFIQNEMIFFNDFNFICMSLLSNPSIPFMQRQHSSYFFLSLFYILVIGTWTLNQSMRHALLKFFWNHFIILGALNSNKCEVLIACAHFANSQLIPNEKIINFQINEIESQCNLNGFSMEKRQHKKNHLLWLTTYQAKRLTGAREKKTPTIPRCKSLTTAKSESESNLITIDVIPLVNERRSLFESRFVDATIANRWNGLKNMVFM